jgi:hypothetical protein
MIDYYEWLMAGAAKNEADPNVGKPTINDLAKMAQVESPMR